MNQFISSDSWGGLSLPVDTKYFSQSLDTKQSIKVSDISICDISSLGTKEYPRFTDAHGWKEQRKSKGLQKLTHFYKFNTHVAWKLELYEKYNEFLNSLYKQTTVGCGSKARVKEKKRKKILIKDEERESHCIRDGELWKRVLSVQL